MKIYLRTHTFLSISVLFVAIVILSCNRGREDETTSPNIVYILADDMGYGDLGSYGQEIIETPNLDRLAAEGMRFTQHYAGNAVCAPSRCALMTGKHMGHAEVRGNKQWEPSGQMPISESTVTIAELLKSAGYTTGMIGKWGLGVEGTSGEPSRQGFDFYYGYLDQVLAHNYYPEYLLRNGEREYLDNEVTYLDPALWHKGLGSYATKKVDYSNDLFTEEAVKFIDKNKDGPFFLYLPYTIPHNNGEALPGEKMEVPDLGIYESKEWSKEQKGYAAMITRLDSSVAVILSHLKKCGLESRTLVMFSSDNGAEMNYPFSDFFKSNGNLRGGKRDLYEGGIRVPLIAYWPGKIKRGTVTDHVSAFWDVLPTFCEVAGMTPPNNIDGISFYPTLMGSGIQDHHPFLYWEFYERSGAKAVRKGSWKAVQRNLYEHPDSPIELYNLDEDVGENKNVADDYPGIVIQMDSIMSTAHLPSKVFTFQR